MPHYFHGLTVLVHCVLTKYTGCILFFEFILISANKPFHYLSQKSERIFIIFNVFTQCLIVYLLSLFVFDLGLSSVGISEI